MSTKLSLVDELKQAAVYEPNDSKRKALREAAGKVAELVRTAQDALDALTSYDGHVSDPMRAEGWTDRDGYEAYANLRAALAAMTGSAS